MKYIPADKLKKYIENKRNVVCDGLDWEDMDECQRYAVEHIDDILAFIDSLQQEQPEVDYNKFEKLFDDFCERNKGHHITSHDACMWFWELGLNTRKEE